MPKTKNAIARIGSSAYKLSLLKVVPGREATVAGMLENAVRKKHRNKPVCMLKLFGNYDIAAIYSTKGFISGAAKVGTIPHILSSNQILAFPWTKPGSADESLNVASAKGHVWGLLFFKLSRALREALGVMAEEQVPFDWRHLEQAQKLNVAVSVLGSLGWAELVVLARGHTFDGVAKVLHEISQTGIPISHNRANLKIPFSAKTFSIIGISFELTTETNQRKLTQKLKKTFTEPFEFNSSTFPVFSVTCSPQNMSAVSKFGGDQIGSAYSTFGATDMIFSPDKSWGWGDFLASVLKMRKTLPDKIYGTSIAVLSKSANQPTTRDPLAFAFESDKPIRVSDSDIEVFGKWGPNFERHLLDLYYGVNSLLQDPIIGECFTDLRRSLDVTMRDLLKMPGAVQDEGLVNLAGLLLDAVTFGAQERAQGTFLALDHLEGPFSPTRGGVQRVLTAVSAIPKSLLGKVKLKWNGFVVAGFQASGFTSVAEVVNIPFNSLFQPEEWWGLFHETGHVAFCRDEFINLDGKRGTKLKDQIFETRNDPAQRTFWGKIFSEIGADLFSLYFCYGKSFNFYLENVWKYLCPHNRQAENEWLYVARAFCAYEYWRFFIVGGVRKFPKSLNFDSEFRAFQAAMNKLSLKVHDWEEGEAESRELLPNVTALIEWFHSEFRKYGAPNDLVQKLKSKEIAAAYNTIRRGEIWTERIREPEYFILKLKQNSNHLDFRTRIAAILSLWHTAVVSD